LGKLVWFKFYPGDWMKDPELRAVSPGARGLWIDMLCLMFECDRRGYLQFNNGTIVTAEHLARMTGSSTDDCTRWLQELETSGVFSRTDNGCIFSRRMLRDEKERSRIRDAVSKHRCNGDVTGDVTDFSVSDSDSSAFKRKEDHETVKKIAEPYLEKIYLAYPKHEAKGTAFKAIAAALKRILSGEDAPPGTCSSMDDAVVYLIQRASLYAKCRQGQDKQYTPLPASWFNAKRYLDDEAEWSRNGTDRQVTQSQRQPSAAVARWHNNKLERERARAAVVGSTGTVSDGQTARLVAGNPLVLDGETS